MRGAPTCPRCTSELAAPDVWSSEWRCPWHGSTVPVQPPVQPSATVLRSLAEQSPVPVWLPWPLPRGWVVTGVLTAGDNVTGVRASAAALGGPNPLGGPAEIVLVAEEPGVGLGARFAGLSGPDPGPVGQGIPYVRLQADGHPTGLWLVPSDADRAVAVGESQGCWLWMVLRPATAGALLVEDLALADVRLLGDEVDVLPFGALTPWLTEK